MLKYLTPPPWYLDDLLNIDNPYFEQMLSQIYPTELQLNKANPLDTEDPFLDLDLSLTNDIVSSKMFDKLDDFTFDIVNFPFLKQSYRYNNFEMFFFSKFYHRHSEMIVKYTIGLITLLQQGISDPVFYGDLVYRFKRVVGKPSFNDQFKKIIKRYKRVGYNMDIMRQSACLVVNPITVYSYGFHLNCTTVDQASDSMMALTKSFNPLVGE